MSSSAKGWYFSPILPAHLSHHLVQHRAAGKRKTIVIVAEGAHDTALNAIRPEQVKDVLANRLGLDSRVTTLGHTQRGGKPCAWDRIMVCMFHLLMCRILVKYVETPANVTRRRGCQHPA